ncbi:hypothetical protein HIM_05234 [Hirsutella minnesotensis 3608]|uniref:Transcription factor domain-containing protein n=1 Tax=Hirsutella minnesotensis 3608 TaxID=1043627 RepID=A0A0F7ZUR2_9HYPO|nr:hypothetical protein HIM_05234 [Hirsutella minnesotensis 3608]
MPSRHCHSHPCPDRAGCQQQCEPRLPSTPPKRQSVEPVTDVALLDDALQSMLQSPLSDFYLSADIGPEPGVDVVDLSDAPGSSSGSPPSMTSLDKSTSPEDVYPLDASNEATVRLSADRRVATLSHQVGGMRHSITMPMSLLPARGHDSYELLSYYLSRMRNPRLCRRNKPRMFSMPSRHSHSHPCPDRAGCQQQCEPRLPSTPPKLQSVEPVTDVALLDDALKSMLQSPLSDFYLSADIGPEPGVDVVDLSDAPGSSSGSPPSMTSLDKSTSPEDVYPLDASNEATVRLSADRRVATLSHQVGGMRHSITMPMSLLPARGHDSYELLSYYLSRTANSMGNGSTEVNPFVAKLVPLGKYGLHYIRDSDKKEVYYPFVAKLVPLAFSNPLVLQLILAQSAAHRQASNELEVGNEVAQQYYTDSLCMFRNVVGDYVSGKDENPLTLTVGSLILCLTEVARGDVDGTIFDHLAASRSLLTTLLDRPECETQFGDLPDFLVEYYMHTAASSMISMDPHSNWQSPLSPSIERMARSLVSRKYIGQLCGCWLELLLLIPQVFQLGRAMIPLPDTKPMPPSADDVITFGFLQSHILAFFPPPSASLYSQLAGLVFKQGVLLYLWSILGPAQQTSTSSVHKDLVQGAVTEAVSLLGQFPASARVNTSLCWPLAVIGCCTTDPAVQDILRGRLQTMVDTIGLGNMRETLILLERVWARPGGETGPWSLHKAMQEHQIWISFA